MAGPHQGPQFDEIVAKSGTRKTQCRGTNVFRPFAFQHVDTHKVFQRLGQTQTVPIVPVADDNSDGSSIDTGLDGFDVDVVCWIDA